MTYHYSGSVTISEEDFSAMVDIYKINGYVDFDAYNKVAQNWNDDKFFSAYLVQNDIMDKIIYLAGSNDMIVSETFFFKGDYEVDEEQYQEWLDDRLTISHILYSKVPDEEYIPAKLMLLDSGEFDL